MWSGGISGFDANFRSNLRILVPKPDGGGGGDLNTLRKDSKPTHAVFVGCLMYPLFRASFIEIGGMACIMPASSWSSHELSLKICALK